MLRANFIFKFFKYKQNSRYEIVQYNPNEILSVQDEINATIIKLDQEISVISNALMEAQIVKLRSTFSRPNNFIEQIGKNIYKTKSEDSINWHKNQLKELYLRRRELEITLEKIQGIFWLNRIKRLLRIILIGFLILLSLFIFLSSFVIMIYLMPFIILIFLGYFLSTKRY